MRLLLALALIGLLAVPATAAAAPTVSLPEAPKVSERDGAARLAVTLSEPSAQPVRVPWATGNAARWIADAPIASPGEDYEAASGTVEFPPGETRAEVAVRILDDAVDDLPGYLAVELGEPENAALGRRFTLVEIADDDPTPAASPADVIVAEGAGAALVPVTRPAPSFVGQAWYGWTTRPGTAGPEDFDVRPGTLSIGWGATSAMARIRVVDDALDEGDQRFEVTLAPTIPEFSPWTPAFAGPVGRPTATVTIVDDDEPAAVSVTPLSGVVRARGRRLTGPVRVPAGSRIDAREGAARITFVEGDVASWATVARGAVRLRGARSLALLSRRVTVRGQRGLRVRGRTVTARPLAPARFSLADTSQGTRVAVRRGRVQARNAVLRTGDARVFGPR